MAVSKKQRVEVILLFGGPGQREVAETYTYGAI
jgi:hypothetical protein